MKNNTYTLTYKDKAGNVKIFKNMKLIKIVKDFKNNEGTVEFESA